MGTSKNMPPVSLNPELQRLAKEFSDWWTPLASKLDTGVHKPLFHYTDMRGMLGILGSEQIWFTSIFHLNDPSELGYGIEMALSVLRDEAQKGGSAVPAFCRWMEHLLVKAGGEVFGFFVASFSQNRDDLGQWRAYADNGRGVAIGLAPKLFEVVSDHSNLGVAEKTLFTDVIYDQAGCMLNLMNVIKRAIAVIIRGEASVTSLVEREEFGKEIARLLAAPIFSYAVTYKHPAYAHERETRLLLINDLNKLSSLIEMRVRGSSLVPYIPSPLRVRSPGAITKIMIGPAADELAEDAIRAFLRKHGLPLDILERSKVPYTAQ
jgi:hypothetical protein